MNVLSKLLDASASHGVFNYHAKCHKVKLTHLCFADDLLIFSKGNVDSIVGIQKILQQFYAFSGLQLNNAKNELFFLGFQELYWRRYNKLQGLKWVHCQLGTLEYHW